MTYTVAAICMEKGGGSSHSPKTPRLIKKMGNLLTGGTATTFNNASDFAFLPAGYDEWVNSESDNILTLDPKIFLTAVNGNICLTVIFGASYFITKAGYVVSVKRLQNNTATTYEIANGWEDHSYYNGIYSDAPQWIPVSLFASGGVFYMCCIEFVPFTRELLFDVKTSYDGVKWTALSKSGILENDPVAEAFFEELGGDLRSLFVARTLSGKYFLGNSGIKKLMYTFNQGNSWIDHPIGRFDGLNWYSDNGVMYLCAVRIGDAGCFGTKICDESGNMFPVEWRESAIPWDWSKTRLDAGYVAGGGANPNPNPVTPIDSGLTWVTSLDEKQYLGDWTLKTVDDCIYAVKAVMGKLIAFDFNKTPGLYDGNGGYINYIYETNNDNRIQQWVDLAESNGVAPNLVVGYLKTNTPSNATGGFGNIEISVSYEDAYLIIFFYWGKLPEFIAG